MVVEEEEEEEKPEGVWRFRFEGFRARQESRAASCTRFAPGSPGNDSRKKPAKSEREASFVARRRKRKRKRRRRRRRRRRWCARKRAPVRTRSS
ncbi:hypothetical protein MPTK2_8g17510 [Marchantia polymorpha subsp. ruderalis]